MNTTPSCAEAIVRYLPGAVRTALAKLDSETFSSITELRIHTCGAVSVCINGKSRSLTNSGITNSLKESVRVSQDELDSFIFKACHGSVYTHEESLKEGYLTVCGGVRIGISGICSVKNGLVTGFSKIKGVTVRLPRHIPGAGKDVLSYIENSGFPSGKGILIASSPGGGKTTLLRDLAKSLSEGFNLCGEKTIMRVCVIDERSEIYMDGIFDNCCIDFLTNMPKAKGMETATRVLSPEVIILDEIGTESEAKEIIKAHSGGVILIASAHADSIEALMARPHIKALIDAGVFGGVFCLERNRDKISGVFSPISQKA